MEGSLLGDFVHPDDREASRLAFRGVGDGADLTGFVNRVRAADGSYRRVEWRARRSPDGGAIFAGARDVTERESMEDRLRGSLAEREALIKEVHHRVKNNMQVVSSLLDLGAMDEADPRFTAVAKEAQGRIRTMALVHEQLYKRDSISSIDLGDYLRELAARVVGEFASGVVDLDVDADRVPLDIDAAIPCGLAVNELVTNSLKYAGADGRRASLRIRARDDGGWCSVTVEDDGPGFPEGAFERSMNGATLGLSLVSGLAAQLRGELRASSGPGARVELRFPLVSPPS
jgi:two-component sensor histidine kinase